MKVESKREFVSDRDDEFGSVCWHIESGYEDEGWEAKLRFQDCHNKPVELNFSHWDYLEKGGASAKGRLKKINKIIKSLEKFREKLEEAVEEYSKGKKNG